MPSQSWRQVLVSISGDGTAVTNTTESSLLTGSASDGKFTLPGNYIIAPGQAFYVRAAGRVSNIVTTPGTLTFRVKFGAIAVATSPAFALNTTAKTNVTWVLEWSLTARTVGTGTGGTLMHTGTWTSESVVGSASGVASTLTIPASAPAVGTGYDTTVANLVDLTAQWSVNNAGNTLQIHEYTLESIN